jgi:hypothetical protein
MNLVNSFEPGTQPTGELIQFLADDNNESGFDPLVTRFTKPTGTFVRRSIGLVGTHLS